MQLTVIQYLFTLTLAAPLLHDERNVNFFDNAVGCAEVVSLAGRRSGIPARPEMALR
jgi:hypothetical protein